MIKYFRHAALAIQETIAYRVAYIINVFASALFYLVIFFIWNAVYGGHSVIAGFTWDQMKGYLLISLFLGAMISGFSEFRIARAIRTGNIVVELLRPVDFMFTNLAVTIGNSLTEGVLVGVILMAFALSVGVVPVPGDPVTWVAFVIALVLSYLTKFLILYLFSLFCFWTTSFMGLNWLRRGLADFFSGAVIPLSFFPDGLRAVADALPFKSMVFVPAGIFIGTLKGDAMWLQLAFAALWIVALTAICRWIWALAMRKVTILGG